MAIKKYYVTVDDTGNVRWHKDAKCTIRHRENGPAVEWADGTNEWWQHGQRHRTDGPATQQADGDKFWYQNGQLHRTDGPAVEWADGNKFWYINGRMMTEEEYNQAVNQNA